MNINDQSELEVRGDIKWQFTSKDVELPIHAKSNVITYSAADIMARLVGGDTNYIPKHIGFMYGADATAAALPEPDSLPANIKRKHKWANVTLDTAAVNANILIAPLVLNPAWSVDGDTDIYNGNAVTVAGFTGTHLEYAFPTDGATYAAAIGDLSPAYFYQALLLTRQVSGSNITYIPFARVSLKDGTYPAKPTGFDLSLFWTITFN